MNKKCFFFRFYILCENFSKIGPMIKKISIFLRRPPLKPSPNINLYFNLNKKTKGKEEDRKARQYGIEVFDIWLQS